MKNKKSLKQLIKNGKKLSDYLKKRIKKENYIRNDVCCICFCLPVHNGEKLKFEIDHIDGNCLNNYRWNLRYICPNCHSQLPTSGGSNKGKITCHKHGFLQMNDFDGFNVKDIISNENTGTMEITLIGDINDIERFSKELNDPRVYKNFLIKENDDVIQVNGICLDDIIKTFLFQANIPNGYKLEILDFLNQKLLLSLEKFYIDNTNKCKIKFVIPNKKSFEVFNDFKFIHYPFQKIQS